MPTRNAWTTARRRKLGVRGHRGRRVAAEFDGEPYYIAMLFGSDRRTIWMQRYADHNAEFANELDAKHLPSRRQCAIKFSKPTGHHDNAGEISGRHAGPLRCTTSATDCTRAS
ncbi:MAG: hypothetical protein ACLSVD_05820 [Eggerthellaceae bacterium]